MRADDYQRLADLFGRLSNRSSEITDIVYGDSEGRVMCAVEAHERGLADGLALAADFMEFVAAEVLLKGESNE